MFGPGSNRHFHSSIRFDLALIVFFVVLANLSGLDPKTVSGLKYDSDFGSVFFLADAKGQWIFVFQHEIDGVPRFGIMSGQFKGGQPYSYYLLNYVCVNEDLTVHDSGIFQMEMYGDLSFRGVWRSNLYDLWGKWGGTKTGSMTAEELDWAKKILSKVQVKSTG
jgi:hypothetical protein